MFRENFVDFLLLFSTIFYYSSSTICEFHENEIQCKSFEFSYYNISSIDLDFDETVSNLHLINGYFIGNLTNDITRLTIDDYPKSSFLFPFRSSSLRVLHIEHTYLEEFPTWLCEFNENLSTIDIDDSHLELIIDHDLHLCLRLKILRIASSHLKQLSTPSMKNLSIQSLFLSDNRLTMLTNSNSTGLQINHFSQLRFLDLSHNQFRSIVSQSFSKTPFLSTLDLSSNQLTTFYFNNLKHFPSIEVLDLRNNSDLQINTNWFPFLPNLKQIYFPYSHFCCHSKIDLQKSTQTRTKRTINNQTFFIGFSNIKEHFHSDIQSIDPLSNEFESICSPLPNEMVPCESLFSSTLMRSIFLIIVLISVGANLAALIINIVRLIVSAYNRWSISTILSSNLALADFISSIYLVFIGIVDLRFQNDFYHQTQLWTTTSLCKFAGFIYIFGIQSSIYALTLLTFERFYTIIFSFRRQTPWPTKFTLLSISFGWLMSFIVASLPLIDFNNAHANSLCVPFRIETSFDQIYLSLLIIFDLCSLGIIITCNGLICFNFSQSHVHTSNDARATVKILTLVIAICISRIPLIIFIFLALIMHRNYPKNSHLRFHDIKLAILFLQPISSIFNPFMYSSLATLKWTTSTTGFERPRPQRKSHSSRSHSRSQSERGYFPLRMMSITSLEYRCSSSPNTP